MSNMQMCSLSSTNTNTNEVGELGMEVRPVHLFVLYSDSC